MKIWNVLIVELNDQNEKPSAGSLERYDNWYRTKTFSQIKVQSWGGWGCEEHNEFQGDGISCNDMDLDKEFRLCKVLN